MLSHKGIQKSVLFICIFFFFVLCGPYAFAVLSVSGDLGLHFLSLCGLTVLSLPGEYQVSLECVVRRSLKFSFFVCLLT